MNYSDLKTADIRLVILRELADTDGYASNESVLQLVLAKYGHAVGRDRVRTDLYWLQEQGLLAINDVGVLVATATQRGLDVATGAATVPGVKRPGPRG